MEHALKGKTIVEVEVAVVVVEVVEVADMMARHEVRDAVNQLN